MSDIADRVKKIVVEHLGVEGKKKNKKTIFRNTVTWNLNISLNY